MEQSGINKMVKILQVFLKLVDLKITITEYLAGFFITDSEQILFADAPMLIT